MEDEHNGQEGKYNSDFSNRYEPKYSDGVIRKSHLSPLLDVITRPLEIAEAGP